jgi:membrane fusion protein, multidrug efflux system
VRIVGTFGETTVIDGPLEASRPVVTQGNYQLTDGEAVRVAQGGGA